MPPPLGLFLRTNKATLHRLRVAHHQKQIKKTNSALQRHIQAVLSKDTPNEAELANATEHLLQVRLLEHSMDPNHDLEDTKTLVAMLEKIRARKLAERKLQLAEKKATET
jgi:hypothetical protein